MEIGEENADFLSLLQNRGINRPRLITNEKSYHEWTSERVAKTEWKETHPMSWLRALAPSCIKRLQCLVGFPDALFRRHSMMADKNVGALLVIAGGNPSDDFGA